MELNYLSMEVIWVYSLLLMEGNVEANICPWKLVEVSNTPIWLRSGSPAGLRRLLRTARFI